MHIISIVVTNLNNDNLIQHLNLIQIPLITFNKKDQMFSEINYSKQISIYYAIFSMQVL